MPKQRYGNLLLVASFLVLALGLAAVADEPLVGVFLFAPPDYESCAPAADGLYASPTACESCSTIDSACMPALEDQLKAQAQVRLFDPTQPEDYEVLLGLQRAHGVRIREMPALFIGNHVLQGEEAIHGQLSDLIDGCLAGGGCPFPS